MRRRRKGWRNTNGDDIQRSEMGRGAKERYIKRKGSKMRERHSKEKEGSGNRTERQKNRENNRRIKK